MDVKINVSHGVLSAMVKLDIEKWIAEHDGLNTRLYLGVDDRLRILRLRTWALRYKVGIPEILDLIVPVLRRTARVRAKRGSLGLTMATLTGIKAEDILKDRLAARYPDGAHLSTWREEERDRQIAAEEAESTDGMPVREPRIRTLLETGDAETFSREYAARITRARVKCGVQAWRKRKRYRDNPWI